MERLCDGLQLAACSRRAAGCPHRGVRRSRHLLKHKRIYAPQALTQERKNPRAQIVGASIWTSDRQEGYRAITRGLFNFTDREAAAGGWSRRAVLIDLIRKKSRVRDTAIVAFADRAPVSGFMPLSSRSTRSSATAQRSQRGEVQNRPTYPSGTGPAARCRRKSRARELQLVAMNQLD